MTSVRGKGLSAIAAMIVFALGGCGASAASERTWIVEQVETTGSRDPVARLGVGAKLSFHQDTLHLTMGSSSSEIAGELEELSPKSLNFVFATISGQSARLQITQVSETRAELTWKVGGRSFVAQLRGAER